MDHNYTHAEMQKYLFVAIEKRRYKWNPNISLKENFDRYMGRPARHRRDNTYKDKLTPNISRKKKKTKKSEEAKTDSKNVALPRYSNASKVAILRRLKSLNH